MDGVLNIYKPPGPTSHDVVSTLRRILHVRRIGHAGTLDPPASGVLLVCVGRATRIVEYLMAEHKAYRATAVLGVETDTEDQTGNVVASRDCSHVTRPVLESILPRFVGRITQVPPMVSAIHHQGRRLYELAREGKTVEREPRPVEIYSLSLIDFRPGEHAEIVLDVECSRGTYIRTLCADIGKALGCGAYMSSLVRTAVGRFRLEDAVTLEMVQQKAAENALADVVTPIADALQDMPCVIVSDREAKLISSGVSLPVESLSDHSLDVVPAGTPVRIHGPDHALLAIGIISTHRGRSVLKPDKVFAVPGGTGD